MAGYRFLADLILLIHVLLAGFMVLGLFLIFAGLVMKWRWVRNPWFRAVHLGTTFYVVIQAWFGAVCPLTLWENALRVKAGDAAYPGSFMAYWLQRILYHDLPGWVFTLCYTVFGVAVLGSLLLVRPGRFRRRTEAGPGNPGKGRTP